MRKRRASTETLRLSVLSGQVVDRGVLLGVPDGTVFELALGRMIEGIRPSVDRVGVTAIAPVRTGISGATDQNGGLRRTGIIASSLYGKPERLLREQLLRTLPFSDRSPRLGSENSGPVAGEILCT